MQYKFGLDPSSKKYDCPQCGHKSCMVAYLDNETKTPVDVTQYGRCDRENNCGYHRHPKEDPELAAKRSESFVPTPDPVVVQIYPSDELVNRFIKRTRTCVSPLHKFLNTKLISNDHLVRCGVYSEDDKTVFVFRNVEQRVVNLKWFKYKDDGHRDKEFKSYSLKNPPPPPDQKETSKQELKHKLCLFGEHLLDPEKKKIVVVVESEKSMAIASFFYPQFDWVSCASNNGLTDDKITVLHNRTVWWLCDADAAGRKNASIDRAVKYISEFYLIDLFPDRNDGYDIADAILDGLRPEIVAGTKRSEEVEIVSKKLEYDESLDYDLPKGVNFADVADDVRKYMHFDHNGRIYIIRKRKANDEKGAPYYATAISNFTIKSLGLIASEMDPTRLVEIKNIYGLAGVVNIPTKAFASPTEFTDCVESVGNFQYDGVGTDLKKIRAKLYDTMLTFDEITTLGWHHSGYFLFANGAYNGKFSPIDKYGFVKLGEKNFFIQPLSCITREESEDWEDEKKFKYQEKKEVGLKEWANLFCEVHKDNGRIALAWYISSLFRDFIYKRFKFFPHLFLFGPPGTGKSQVGWSIRSLGFTGLVKPFNLNTGTAVAFHREFSHFRNFPAWCDEYSNSMPFERIQALKAAYDGVGHKKSVKDSEMRTKSTQVNRAIMISGQELPIADNALFKRVILLQFQQTEYTTAEKKLFADLQTMEEGGLTFITAGFMHFRKTIEEKYIDAFDMVLADMMVDLTSEKIEVEDRIVRNACIALTTIHVLQKDLGDRLPFDYKQLKQILVASVKEQMSLISNSNETSTFWDTVMYLTRDRRGNENGKPVYAINEGEDFCFEDKFTVKIFKNGSEYTREFGENKELLFIRFNKIIGLYREAFKRQNNSSASPMDKGSLLHYLQHSKSFIGYIDKYSFKDSRTSCYCFDYGMLKTSGIYLGGSELVQGAPPSPNSNSPPTPTSSDDLPF